MSAVSILGIRIPTKHANFLFAFGQLIGQAGQSVSLPLWAYYLTESTPYFIFVFASFAFTVIFGAWTGVYWFTKRADIIQSHRDASHWNMFLIGMNDAFNGLLAVFSAPGGRTSVSIQGAMGNFTIPITVLFRYVILRKLPTRRQNWAVLAIIVGLFVCMVPTFANWDSTGTNAFTVRGGWRVFWPMCFMLSFVPAAIMNVIQERELQGDGRGHYSGGNTPLLTQDNSFRPLLQGAQGPQNKINIIYFQFWTSLYQFLVALALFGFELIPEFGMSKNLHDLGVNIKSGLVDTFSSNGACTGLAAAFIGFYILSYLTSSMLIRHDEGATWASVVASFVAPMTTIFWYLFNDGPLAWNPHFPLHELYIVAGVVVMSVGVYFYYREKEEVTKM